VIRVCSFNLRNGLAFDGCNSWPCRRRATLAVLAGIDADVAGLQEAFGFQAHYLARHLPDVGVSGDGRSARRRGERCCVLHREATLELVSADTRWFGEHHHHPGTRLPGASFPRVATIVELAIRATGQRFRFVNTHLDEHRDDNRVRAAEQLVEWLGDGPAVLAGDLNATPTSEAVRTLEAAGLRQALPPDAGGTNHGFTGRTDGRRIDHILVSGHWEVADGRVVTERPGGRLPSDHWPVVADLRLPGPQTEAVR
jgi:endonuclease/exonuclease/phosphatase family metal-dependent hydrolase